MARDDLPEELEQDLLPPYEEQQRWYSGFVHLRHAHGYSEKWSAQCLRQNLTYGRAVRCGLPAGVRPRMKCGISGFTQLLRL